MSQQTYHHDSFIEQFLKKQLETWGRMYEELIPNIFEDEDNRTEMILKDNPGYWYNVYEEELQKLNLRFEKLHMMMKERRIVQGNNHDDLEIMYQTKFYSYIKFFAQKNANEKIFSLVHAQQNTNFNIGADFNTESLCELSRFS